MDTNQRVQPKHMLAHKISGRFAPPLDRKPFQCNDKVEAGMMLLPKHTGSGTAAGMFDILTMLGRLEAPLRKARHRYERRNTAVTLAKRRSTLKLHAHTHTHTTHQNAPRDRLVLELRVELGGVEVRHEGGGQHRHEDQGAGVHPSAARENRLGVLRQSCEETAPLDVAVATPRGTEE